MHFTGERGGRKRVGLKYDVILFSLELYPVGVCEEGAKVYPSYIWVKVGLIPGPYVSI